MHTLAKHAQKIGVTIGVACNVSKVFSTLEKSNCNFFCGGNRLLFSVVRLQSYINIYFEDVADKPHNTQFTRQVYSVGAQCILHLPGAGSAVIIKAASPGRGPSIALRLG